MTNEITIHLSASQFTEQETPLVEWDEFSASVFRYASGVCAVRLRNARGELIALPFQGQQIWDATLDGRRLTMKSMFDQPYPTRDFLATYGGFLLHCGATAMGAPGPEDQHPLHGELPNAPYQAAQVILGEDERGQYIGLSGTYRHTVAFNTNYGAQPVIKLYAGSSVFVVSMTITNLKQSDMPLMYLAHINFLPVDNGRLLYSARCDAEHMCVRADVPDFMQVAPGYREFVRELSQHPEKHLVLKPDLVFDPEVVFLIDYVADAQDWAHALQIHPDGCADVVRHRIDQLKFGVRWICRTVDQQALGFEPATAGVSGFTAEKLQGRVRALGAGETFHCEIEIGTLTEAEAEQEAALVHYVVDAAERQ
jgi:hypothetical protein